MIYYLDGYNLLFQLFEERDDFKSHRDELISFLETHLQYVKFKVKLIFDAHHSQERLPQYEYSRHLEIIFTPRNMTADEFILEQLSVSRHPGQITVVTNDKSLRLNCHNLKAMTMSPKSFIRFLKKKGKKAPSIENFEDTPENIERLLQIFEKYDR